MQQSCLVEVAIKVAAGKQCIDVALHAEHHAVRAQPCARRRPHRFKHTEIACALARVSPDLSHNIQTSYTGIQARKLQPKHRNRTGADLVADSDIATACMETSKVYSTCTGRLLCVRHKNGLRVRVVDSDN